MTFQPHRFAAPDGTELVIITAEEYKRLLAAAEELEDIADAERISGQIAAGEPTIPGEVVNLMITEGLNPVAAWRRHRGLSQVELAERAGVSQAAVARLEKAEAGSGRAETRRAIANALGVPLSALDPLD